jgi:arginyl-tRNA synthetase
MVGEERKVITDANWPEYYENRDSQKYEASLPSLEYLRTADLPPYTKEATVAKIREVLTQQGLPPELAASLSITSIPIEKGFGFGLHCGPLAKHYKENPQKIAETLKNVLSESFIRNLDSVTAVNGYLNLEFNPSTFGTDVVKQVFERQGFYGSENIGQGERVVIDMSSPNIAKAMSVAHLRSTIIGESLSRIYTFTGHDVVKDNHIGDWGTQFGHLLYALELWGDEIADQMAEDPIEALQNIYVRISDLGDAKKYADLSPEEAEQKAEAVQSEGRKRFLALEKGDQGARKKWQQIVDWSLAEYQKMYDMLGVKFDLVNGESFYESMLSSVTEKLEADGIAHRGKDNALVVDFTDSEVKAEKQLGVVPVLKSDGATLYMTRDLATAVHRVDEIDADQMIYVVGGEQQDYFKKFFGILRRMNLDIAEKSKHVWFGLVTLPDGAKMSTRKGTAVLLKDVVSESLLRVEKMLEERTTLAQDEVEKKNVIRQVAVGALIWADLMKEPRNSVTFDWDDMLTLKGNSGPYVQYMNARTRSVLSKAEAANITITEHETIKVSELEEQRLVELLASFPEQVKLATREYNPSVIATFAYQLAQTYSHFYDKHKIIDPTNLETTKSRLALSKAVNICLENALNLLAIEAPAKM